MILMLKLSSVRIGDDLMQMNDSSIFTITIESAKSPLL